MFHRLMSVVLARKFIEKIAMEKRAGAEPAPSLHRRQRALGSTLMGVGLSGLAGTGLAFPEIGHEYQVAIRGLPKTHPEAIKASAIKAFRSRWAKKILAGSVAVSVLGAWLNDQFAKD
jgi:hypothetical protein